MSISRQNTASSTSVLSGRNLLVLAALITLPMAAQAAAFDTYVLPTYGGDALLLAVRQQLNSSRDGGTVTTYQDKLILQTTAANYQAVQQLLTQIDRQPQALMVAVRVGNTDSRQGNIQQGRVIISNRGVQATGMINQRRSQQQSSSVYQVQTLSGSAASIGTGALYSLTPRYQATTYPSPNHPTRQIVIQQHVLLPTAQGISVTPKLLPNGQVEVKLSQVDEQLTTISPAYSQHPTINSQRLNSTIIVPRGQWVTVGHITQNTQNQRSGYDRNRQSSHRNAAPIQLLVQ